MHKAWITTLLVVANSAVIAAMAIGQPSGPYMNWLEALLAPTSTMLVDYGGNFGPFTLMFGQGWRLLTCAFLHKGVIHLVLNMIALWFLGRRAERLIGPLRYTVVCLATAIGASLGSLLWQADLVGVGSSGLIFGLIGLLVALGQRGAVPDAREYAMFSGVTGIVFAGFATALGLLTPGIDNAAHLGGLTIGLIFGFAFADESSLARIWSMRSTAVALLAMALLGAGYVAESAVLVKHNPTLQALGEEQVARSLTEGKNPKTDTAAFEAAVNHLDKAIALNPQAWLLHLAKAQTLAAIKRFDEAIAECEKASSAVDKDAEKILFNQAIIYHGAGNDRKAVDCNTELLSLYEKNDTRSRQAWDFGVNAEGRKKALAYNNRAWSLLVLKEYDKALSDIDNALQIDSTMGTAYDTRGVILFHMKRYKEALEALDKAVKIDSKRGEYYWHRAQVYKALSEDSKAADDLLKSQLREYEPEAWELERSSKSEAQ